uniref:Uncharacterized protein n=1 Tax=Opuntia streptacantha TaxID=393608 RepID=A0A7C9DXI6_OPUST
MYIFRMSGTSQHNLQATDSNRTWDSRKFGFSKDVDRMARLNSLSSAEESPVEGLVTACLGRWCDVLPEATKVMATVVKELFVGLGSDFSQNRREEEGDGERSPN